MNWLVWTVPIIGILAILFAVWLVRGVLCKPTETSKHRFESVVGLKKNCELP